MTATKEFHLEGMRGIAAMIVVVFHCIGAFFPTLGMMATTQTALALKGTLWWGLLNGSHAVIFFFVLSGYVLARRPLVHGDRKAIVEGAIKRWPRLAGPVLIAVMASYTMAATGLDLKNAIYNVHGYDWILRAGTAHKLEPNLVEAMAQGSFFTFFRGDISYISALWTMRYEFIGSFVVFGLCLMLIELKGHIYRSVFLVILCVALAHYASPYIVPFLIGVGIALLKPIDRDLDLGKLGIAASLLVVFYLSGYASFASGPYQIIRDLGGSRIPEAYYHSVSATLLILAVESSPKAKRVLSGSIGKFIGRISFPIYLLHMIVVTTAGAVVFVALENAGELTRGLVATAVVLWLSVIVSLPLARFNDAWVRWINSIVAAKSQNGSPDCSARRPQAVT